MHDPSLWGLFNAIVLSNPLYILWLICLILFGTAPLILNIIANSLGDPTDDGEGER